MPKKKSAVIKILPVVLKPTIDAVDLGIFQKLPGLTGVAAKSIDRRWQTYNNEQENEPEFTTVAYFAFAPEQSPIGN